MPELTPQDMFKWLDELAACWDIDNGKGGTVRSFRVFSKNELPASVTPGMAPCAITYPGELEIEYSAGGPTLFWWVGQTYFYLTEDSKPSNLQYILPFFVRIVKAAAGHAMLGGTVKLFTLAPGPGAIKMITYKKADGTDGQQGLVVEWKVKQDVSGLVTVSQ